MTENRFTILTGRYFADEVTPEEEKELELLLKAEPVMAAQFRVMQQFWQQEQEGTSLSVEEGLQKLMDKLALDKEAKNCSADVFVRSSDFEDINSVIPQNISKSKTIVIRKWIKITAAAILISGFFLAVQYLQRPSQIKENGLMEKQNAKGIKSTIELADGSKIWLNADSKINYPEIFTGNTREVYLNGEAFFSIAKNPEKPFIIHLSRGTIKVLGTSFNVRAYENEKIVETSVSTGRVAFIPNYEQNGKKKDTVFLLPDNKVRYFLNRDEVITTPTSAREDKAWTEGKLVFKSRRMEDISIELERNFGKKVVFLNEEPKDFILTGSFQNNSLDEIMFYLSETKSFSYKITNTELIIASTAEGLKAH